MTNPSSASIERTYCNPIPLPDYPRGRTSVRKESDHGWVNSGIRRDFRETADPSVLYHDDTWYLYPSCGMAWVSEDFVIWKHVPMNLNDIGYAPTIMLHKGAFYLTASDAALYRAAGPLGPWEEVGPMLCPDGAPLPHYTDPMLFSDDDGRVYCYWGCGGPGIFGVEMNGGQLNRAITEPRLMFSYNPDHVWERYGEYNEDISTSWVEGPWMLKHNGTYYLAYCAPGTNFRTYAMGAYVGRKPLGPYEYQERNPILRDTDGFVRGPGHGCFVWGPNKTLWAFYTCVVAYHHIFERRIGFDPAGFDAKGNLYSIGASEIPQWAPGVIERPQDGNDAGLLPLTINKYSSASSSAPGRVASHATDHDIRNWWQPADDDREPWLEVNMSSAFTASALRLIWAEPNLDYDRGVLPGPFRYRVEMKLKLNDPWETVVDKTDNQTDMLIEYLTFQPRKAKFARLIIAGWPRGLGVGVVDFSVFGVGEYPRPGKYGVWPELK